MGRSLAGADAFASGDVGEVPEHTASISDFHFDVFEVTVGRFRAFVSGFGGPPAPGAGAHPLIAGSGWQGAWDAKMASDALALAASLKCGVYATWTDVLGPNENKPINCVSWYEAFAFCAWDGGRLPTEAEWEYAAAAGAENRLYPWGQEAPTSALALFGGNIIADVGSTISVGKWGQEDLAGNVWEWNLDALDAGWYAGAGMVCNDCANLAGDRRVLRGGAFYAGPDALRSVVRGGGDVPPESHHHGVGFRCAR